VGLELVADGEGNLFAEAGVAVDGFGRELVLAERQGIGQEVFADKGSDILDVYLNYNRTGSDDAPEGYAGCGDDGDIPFYRWQERPFLTYQAPEGPPVDRRRPPDVLEADLAFDATGDPPDHPERGWPVFIGQITLDRTNEAQPFTVDLAGRPYVGLVGEMVRAPSGRAHVQIGAERQGDPYRFAIFVPAAGTPSRATRKPRLAIRRGNTVTIRGDTTLYGDLTIDGHAVEFRPGPERPRTGGPPRIYHVQNATEHELRVEMVDQATTPQQVVIGTWSAEDEAFRPCLTIANDCTVTVHGNLVIEGVFDPPEPSNLVDAGLSEEAQRLVTGSVAAGVSGANALLSTVYKTPFPQAALAVTAAAITASPSQRALFAQILKTQAPDVAALLAQALTPEEGGPS
jgi:hypothetical protein